MSETLILLKVPDPRCRNAEYRLIAMGSRSFLAAVAKKRGWKWKKDSTLFGGYWVDIQTGDSYMYDVPGEAKEVK
jgi:hypothetical protein